MKCAFQKMFKTSRPPSLHPHTYRRYRNFSEGGGRFSKTKTFKEMFKINWNFQRGRGIWKKKTLPWERYGHFLELHNSFSCTDSFVGQKERNTWPVCKNCTYQHKIQSVRIKAFSASLSYRSSSGQLWLLLHQSFEFKFDTLLLSCHPLFTRRLSGFPCWLGFTRRGFWFSLFYNVHFHRASLGFCR